MRIKSKIIVKIIPLVFLMLFLSAIADVIPYYFSSIKNSPMGFVFVKSPVIMRNLPQKEANVVEMVNFDFQNNVSCFKNNECKIEEVFTTYLSDKKTAIMTAVDESQGYSLVCFNQKNGFCGWVSEEENKFYTLNEFINIYGKKNGLYILKDLSKSEKVLYASNSIQTNSTGEIKLAHSIIPWLIRGNWILVKVVDLGYEKKTGWFNYRDENGKLKLFVKFD